MFTFLLTAGSDGSRTDLLHDPVEYLSLGAVVRARPATIGSAKSISERERAKAS